MHADNLCLEVTRKCNLRCAHCLRGNSQRMVMSDSVIFHTFRGIESINTLTFTGGEPSLAPEVIESVIQNMFWQKNYPDYFYVVSNGMPHNKYSRFLRALDRLYDLCNEKSLCVLEISRDQFHQFDPKMYNLFERFGDEERYCGEPPEYFQPNNRTKYISEPLNEGRAIETGVGIKDSESQKPWEIAHDCVQDLVYVSANGNVVSCCNMSYKRIDKESKGNVLTTSLSEIVESSCIRLDEESQIAG